MTCPPSTKPRITLFASPSSVHVALWLEALARCRLPVRIETAAGDPGECPAGVPVSVLAPGWLRRPAALRYLWAGLRARLQHRAADEIIHAHCTSGYGLMAWLCGHPYIVTTYGSEVLAADDRGRVYRWLVHQVLRHAARITATSPQMVDVLTDVHGIPRERIHLFDLGLNTDIFRPASDADLHAARTRAGIDPAEPVWISVKRAIPMNRTLEIVTAFEQYCAEHTSGHLVVICGDDEGAYSDQVKQRVAASPHAGRITLLAEWLSPPEVARWLQIADFAISVPTSDQMSNAVLEAMACGCLPILLKIDGYRSLRERGACVHWVDECTVDQLSGAIRQVALGSPSERLAAGQKGVEFIRAFYSNRAVGDILERLYNLSDDGRLPGPSTDPDGCIAQARHAA